MKRCEQSRPDGLVAIVYDFFPHYRAAVLRELLERGVHRYLLVGDRADPHRSGIRAWNVTDARRFLWARCRVLPYGALWQDRLLRLALRADVKAIIYLGDVHCAATWLSAALARLTGKRVLFWTIGWHRDEGGAKDFVRRAFYRLANGLLLYGHYAKQLAMARGFSAERLYVVYNSLDYDAQRKARAAVSSERVGQVRRELFPEPDRPLLICVSRLVAKRGLDLMLDAMVVLVRDGFPVNLLLVGEGPERARLEAFAVSHDLAVRFYGACYDERVLAELVMAADATVAPGMVGLTAMQSLAYGTPVVTHDDWNRQAPEWEAIVPGKSGCFFRFGDSGDLARAVRECTQRLGRGSEARAYCDETVARFYNPAFQRRVIDRSVAGEPADDLFWMRGPKGGAVTNPETPA
jgi:glycosyltransferase involved in cell wall biosynthesis